MISICAVILVILFLVVWFGCGLIAAGYSFAHFQRSYPMLRKQDFYHDQKNSVADILLGIGALVGLMFSPRYRSKGWLNPWGKKAKQEVDLKG